MNEVYEVGETVTLSRNGRIPIIVPVIRITPSGRVVIKHENSEITYNKDGSERTSNMWNFSRIRHTTQEDLDAIELIKLRTAINKVNWLSLSIAELKSVLQVLGIEVS